MSASIRAAPMLVETELRESQIELRTLLHRLPLSESLLQLAFLGAAYNHL